MNIVEKLQKLFTWGDIVATNDISYQHNVPILQQLKVMLLCSKYTSTNSHIHTYIQINTFKQTNSDLHIETNI
jgi:hypothetical protein